MWLSDLESDPGERKNLRHNEAARADELLTMAQKWVKEVEAAADRPNRED